MEGQYQTRLTERRVPGVPKKFDFVSPDGVVVGDAKFLTLVRRKGTPPAKNMEIAGHVWLLERTQAKTNFLIFGNQREVVVGWLKKYGSIAGAVEFWFLDPDGALERLR